ncbi:MAG: hypothetical protein VCA36_11145 [Opitutales bacterium]
MKRFITLFAACVVTCGCSDSESIFGDATKTQDPGPDQVEMGGSQGNSILRESRNYQPQDNVRDILDDGLGRLKEDLEKSINAGDRFEYEKVSALFGKTLDEKMQPPAKFQFIADVNERWVYRCNLQTGEIECFSMSVSNKLRLLSSIK